MTGVVFQFTRLCNASGGSLRRTLQLLVPWDSETQVTLASTTQGLTVSPGIVINIRAAHSVKTPFQEAVLL